MIGVSRPVHCNPGSLVSHGGWPRPLPGGAPVVTGPLPVAIPGQQPYAGMDPSNQATWVRPFIPTSGMIAYLNVNGAAAQGNTDMGGVWSNPAKQDATVAARPKRRPR